MFLVQYLMEAINVYVPVKISPRVFLVSILAAIAISVISSISPALKSGKLNIIESIKYE